MNYCNPLKLALIGCGYWGRKYLNTLLTFTSAQLVKICDSNFQLLPMLKTEFPDLAFTGSLEEIWEDSEIKGVIIATPAGTHFDLARQALEAGKDVLVEKPLVLNTTQGIELQSLAKRTRKLLMVAHIYAYHPAVQLIKKLLNEGALGELYYLNFMRTTLGPLRRDINPAWDMGVHDISILLHLFECLPKGVSAQGVKFIGEVEDAVFMQLFYQKALAQIQVSWFNPRRIRELMLVGSKQTLVFDEVANPWELMLYRQGFQTAPQALSLQVPLAPDALEVLKIESRMPLELMSSHFIDCISSRREPDTGVEVGLQAVNILEKVEASLQAQGAYQII
jgi:predicted dehydrogenase